MDVLKEFKHTRYVCFQLEKGEEGTPHFQGYIEFRTAVALTGLKKIAATAHWETRRDTRAKARDYCRKEDTRLEGPWEHGDFNAGGAGSRTDLQLIGELAVKTGSFRACCEEDLSLSIKYHNGLKAVIAATRVERTEPPRVALFYGPTGTGKTKQAYAQFPDLFRKHPGTRWFDGYEGQESLLLDDFGGASSKLRLDYVLQLLDRYPFTLEIKGSYTPLLATKIVITTNIHPKMWYDYSKREEQYKALARRIHGVFWFKSMGDPCIRLDHPTFFSDWFETCDEETILVPHSDE